MRYNEYKKKQIAAKQTFGFSGSLTDNYPVMQDKEHKYNSFKLSSPYHLFIFPIAQDKNSQRTRCGFTSYI